ncbi:N-acetyltransferase [Salinibacterium amurskyense]|uniref:GNAT family N-acetyltransferase n=1 Tax=Salinibacterium amurskyense TaxID=205941 RepID=UPI00311E2066
MTTLSFRAATTDDIPALVALVTSAYRGEASRAGWTSEADLIDGERIDAAALEADLSRDRSVILLAGRGDQLVACAHVADVDGDGYFGMFAVDPAQQGSGLGSVVLAEAENYAAREWAVAVMQMTVIDVREELIAFYERRGYVRTGITKPFPYGDERVGTPRRDDLQFELLTKTLGAAGQHPASSNAAATATAAGSDAQ